MDIIKKFNLPSYIKGKSFSEASALIAKKFEDKSDPESVETLNDLQGRLQEAQEYVKAEKAKQSQPAATSESLSVGQSEDAGASAPEQGGVDPNMLPETTPDGNEKALGGILDFLKNKGGDALGAAQTAATPAPTIGGGALKGASAGMAFGPIGGAIGAVVGGIGGLIGSKKRKREQKEREAEENRIAVNESNANFNNNFKSGGHLLANSFEFGGKPKQFGDSAFSGYRSKGLGFDNDFSTAAMLKGRDAEGTSYGKYGDEPDYLSGKGPSKWSTALDSAGNALDKGASAVKNANLGTLLRYAPAAMNYKQLKELKQAGPVGANTVNTNYKKNYIDEAGMQNVVKGAAANTREAILNASNGSTSAARANLLASQLQSTKALSSAYQSAQAQNNQEDARENQMKNRTGMFNARQEDQARNINLEQKAAYDTNRSRLLAQLGQDLGGIGKEELLKLYPERMGLNYDSKGRKIKAKKKKTKK